jgi:hypothetical protein
MRLAIPLAALIGIALLSGCGDSDGPGSGYGNRGSQAETSAAPPGASARACGPGRSGVEDLRATNVGCAEARQVASGWRRARECDRFASSSRSGCSLLSYRCQATAVGRGWSISCAKPNRSIAFSVRRG